jgi:hypothetical protein
MSVGLRGSQKGFGAGRQTIEIKELTGAVKNLVETMQKASLASLNVTDTQKKQAKAVKKTAESLREAVEAGDQLNKRTNILNAVIQANNREFKLGFKSFKDYMNAGGTTFEYFATFMTSTKEEVRLFGVEAQTARRIMYGFLPPGMFRMVNKTASAFNGMGSIIRALKGDSEESNSIFMKSIKVMGVLTRTRNMMITKKQRQAAKEAKQKIKEKAKTIGPISPTDPDYAKVIKLRERMSKIRAKKELKAAKKLAKEKQKAAETQEKIDARFALRRAIAAETRYYKIFEERKAKEAKENERVENEFIALHGKRPANLKFDENPTRARKRQRRAEQEEYDTQLRLFKHKDADLVGARKQTSSAEQNKNNFNAGNAIAKAQERLAKTNPIRKNLGKVMKFAKGIMGKFKTFLNVAVKGIFMFMLTLVATLIVLQALWPTIKRAFTPAMEMLMMSLSYIGEGFTLVFSGVMDLWNAVFKGGSIGDILLALLDILLGVWKIVVGILGALLGTLLAFIGAFVVDLVVQAINWVKSLGDNVKSVGKVVGLILAIAGMIIAFLLGAAPIVIVAVGIVLYKFGNWFIDKIKKYLPKNPVKSAKKFLTGRATGGVVGSGETTLVGEMGPEIVKLPAGSRVYSNEDSKKMAKSDNITNNFHITINARDTSDKELKRITEKIGKEIANKLNRRLGSPGFI